MMAILRILFEEYIHPTIEDLIIEKKAQIPYDTKIYYGGGDHGYRK